MFEGQMLCSREFNPQLGQSEKETWRCREFLHDLLVISQTTPCTNFYTDIDKSGILSCYYIYCACEPTHSYITSCP